MATFIIKKGRDIKLKGAASKEVVTLRVPSQVAIKPLDIKGIKPRLVVKPDDLVKVGTPLLEDKYHPEIKLVSPASGKVLSINRGDKRALLSVVVQTDGRQEPEIFQIYTSNEIRGLSREVITKALLQAGFWPCLRQRPFSKIAAPGGTPKSIFVQAMNTEPLALDIDAVLDGLENEFQAGLDALTRLTNGAVTLCCRQGAKSKALTQAKNVQTHFFSGPHPAGNVGTHIHHVDPLGKGEVVWHIRAEDVLRIGSFLIKGIYSPEKFVAVTGEGAPKAVYVRTIVGAPVSHLVQGTPAPDMRYLSGSVLSGQDVGPNGFLGFYDSQITVLPKGGRREFLGWISPGFNKYSFSRTFFSALTPNREISMNTDKNGSDRAIVLNDVYDKYVSLDIMTFFLIKAVWVGDIEEMERLGILECDEEDFALCTFACPSKFDVGAIVRQGLDMVEKDS